jgi:hypothetical protein
LHTSVEIGVISAAVLALVAFLAPILIARVMRIRLGSEHSRNSRRVRAAVMTTNRARNRTNRVRQRATSWVVGIAAVAVAAATLTALPSAATSSPGCPCTIWPSAAAPKITATGDSRANELGVKFRADVNGFVTGVRFYKGTTNTGIHVGHLWTSGGALLASATFTSESANGWQQVTFSSPVAVTANTVYLASYYAPHGHYAADQYAFASVGVDTAPLHALRDGVSGADGVYRYRSSGFPTSTYHASNYWVDVVFVTSSSTTTASSHHVPCGTPVPD